MANTFHVAVHVRSIPDAVESYRKLLGIEPAKVHHDYAKFEIEDPPVILSLNLGGEPGTLSHLGIRHSSTEDVAREMTRTKDSGIPVFQQDNATCCYARADKFWARDADDIPWEMYTLLQDVEAETAADPRLREFLANEKASSAEAAPPARCCVPG